MGYLREGIAPPKFRNRDALSLDLPRKGVRYRQTEGLSTGKLMTVASSRQKNARRIDSQANPMLSLAVATYPSGTTKLMCISACRRLNNVHSSLEIFPNAGCIARWFSLAWRAIAFFSWERASSTLASWG